MAGQPKRFKKKEFENYVLDYFADIYEQQTEDGTTDIPTFYGFYRYVSQRRDCSYHTVRRCFDEYWADIKKDFEAIRADLLVRGGAMGRYHCTMVIVRHSYPALDKLDRIIEIIENKFLTGSYLVDCFITE